MNRLQLVLAIVCLGGAVRANDAAVTGVGGTIELMDEHPSIALVAEHVHARVDHLDDAVAVECLFVLTNRGEADTVQVGFPESFAGDTGPRPFTSFRCTVDGEEVPCTRREGKAGAGSPFRFWWTRNVHFAAGQTRIIRDVYTAPAGHSVGDARGAGRFFEYTLLTGRSWAGPIAVATFTLTVATCDTTWVPVRFLPDPAYSRDCESTWCFRWFEPGRSGPQRILVGWREPEGER